MICVIAIHNLYFCFLCPVEVGFFPCLLFLTQATLKVYKNPKLGRNPHKWSLLKTKESQNPNSPEPGEENTWLARGVFWDGVTIVAGT